MRSVQSADLEQADQEILAHVASATAAMARGEAVEAKRTIRFENWATFFKAVTPNRIGVLEYVAERDAVPSTRTLAVALGRDYAAVHADVTALLKLRLLERDGNVLRCETGPDGAELAAA
jgi:predicted transcriptional regulator